LTAEQFLRLEKSQGGKTLIPTYMASVIPQNYVELLEHPSPSSMLRQRVQHLGSVAASTAGVPWRYPKLDIPEQIQQFGLKEVVDGTGRSIAQVVDLLGTGDDSLVSLALLGWNPIDLPPEDSSSNSPHPVVSLGCSICLSLMELTLEKRDTLSQSLQGRDDAQAVDDRPTKRQKKLARFCNPYDAHRHYCPYKCGFPKSIPERATPMWQVLLSRLLKENDSKNAQQDAGTEVTTTDPDEVFDKIRKILRSAIVPKKVDLSNDEEDG
jgi:hypothetical protein